MLLSLSRARTLPAPRYRRLSCVALAILILAGLPSLTRAQGTNAIQESGGDWNFSGGIYGWLQNIHGELESPDGTEHEFNIPFSEIFPHVTGVLEVVTELGWRKWFFVFDGTWEDLSGSYTGQVFDLDVDLSLQIYDLHAGYGVYKHLKEVEAKPGEKPWSRASVVDILVGARYFGTQVKLRETTLLTGNTRENEFDSSRWDPFFGARGVYSLGNRWAATLVADIGGFGIGNAAKFTYQLDANIAYRVSHPFSVYVGYRVLDYELPTESGGSSDVTQYGAKIGVVVNF